MDNESLLKMSGASAGTIAIVLLIYKILKSVVGKRLVSTCCERKMEVSLDIKEATTPIQTKPELKTNPMYRDERQPQSGSERSDPDSRQIIAE
jgi:hypothetical protein